MDIERALETQRLALLRLLAGLALMLEFVSFAPVVLILPTWFRSYVSTILARAEAAADCLLIVSARRLAKNGERVCGLAPPSFERDIETDDDVVTLGHLRSRVWALRARLNNLPRHAKRLLKRIAHQGATCEKSKQSLRLTDLSQLNTSECFSGLIGFIPRVERPPDNLIHSK